MSAERLRSTLHSSLHVPETLAGDFRKFWRARGLCLWARVEIKRRAAGAVGAAAELDMPAALEPMRQGVRHAVGRFAKDVARGLNIRCDWGPQSIADAWITR